MPKKKKKSAEKKEALQPAITIGMIGHVDHGKTTLLEAFSGKWADTHSEELKRGITIKLGYADATFYRCTKCGKFNVHPKCPSCLGDAELLRKVSFVDAPGHESLMATMLAGATIMDGALLLVAANEKCPQPQTREHLMALQIIGVKNLIVVQNKIDLTNEEQAMKNYEQIKAFLKGTEYEKAPIIPLSAQHSVGISNLIEAIEDLMPTPKRDPDKDPLFFAARSFDVNRPGSDIRKMIGGIIGGALKTGTLSVGDEIVIKLGYETMEKNQKVYKDINTKIIALKTGGSDVDTISPGGSVAILTQLDPAIVKSDSLSGCLIGYPDKIPKVWYDFELETTLLERVVGSKEELDVEPIKMTEVLMLNVNSSATVGVVTELGKNKIKCKLKRPVCADPGSRVTISRMIGNRFRLIGYGVIGK